ncbi:uncharacterized protein CLUP02_07280 [Colletotrichum lupini]|uniref:Uncharacterized protein n=1 Tax=Colletotrichum lupini TaxID=145971 RepID=A0A9Q8SQP1_9PEZI|nr:uncharacterized protein CLUP02_07280 [Colletotrichum lupini]UQC81794.1 hypothetical protein CLUP02_07280 [Colletotrichum lupini]
MIIIKKRRAYYFTFLTNKEFIIIIKAISITKDYILAFLILSSFIYIVK